LLELLINSHAFWTFNAPIQQGNVSVQNLPLGSAFEQGMLFLTILEQQPQNMDVLLLMEEIRLTS